MIKERWKKLRKRISKRAETRFFKKHGVSSWRAYDLKYDKDFNAQASSIRHMFHGYPYIVEVTTPDVLTHSCPTCPDGLEYLRHWLKNDCRGKTRSTIQRTIEVISRDVDGRETNKDWALNEIGGRDSLFVAFKDERDYLMFLLKWESS